MTALQIVGIVLAAIALLVAALLCIPGRLLVSYDAENGFQILGSVLFFRFGGGKQTAPKKEKKPKEQSAPTEETKPEGKKSSPDLRTLAAHAGELAELLGKTLNSLGTIARSIMVRELSLTCIVGGDDPAEAADTYGRICAVLYPALAALHAALRVREDHEQITIGCAFGEESRFAFRMLLQLRAVHVLRATLPLTPPILKLLRSLLREKAAARQPRPAKASSPPQSD